MNEYEKKKMKNSKILNQFSLVTAVINLQNNALFITFENDISTQIIMKNSLI